MMRQFSMRSWLKLCGLVLGILVLTAGLHPAFAQYGGLGPSASNPASLQGGSRIQGPETVKRTEAPPDALPGAAPRADRVAPVQGAPIANPTDALFDAINRGDIASARDAVDRGADLDGPGILGMTPIDLSVDLGRNDITFLLLSLRNGDGRPGRPAATQTAKGAPAGKPVPGHGTASASTPTKVAARAPASPPKPASAPINPTLASSDSGTPNPGAGFLGFGRTSTP